MTLVSFFGTFTKKGANQFREKSRYFPINVFPVVAQPLPSRTSLRPAGNPAKCMHCSPPAPSPLSDFLPQLFNIFAKCFWLPCQQHFRIFCPRMVTRGRHEEGSVIEFFSVGDSDPLILIVNWKSIFLDTKQGHLGTLGMLRHTIIGASLV